MARSRCLPTELFELPDFFELASDTQVALVGLVLCADDYGRGIAHPGLLARKLNKEVQIIEEALAILEERELLRCYEVGRRRYYTLLCWKEWQALHKPTPSKYPAPPPAIRQPTASQDSLNFPQFTGEALKYPGNSGESSLEEEEEEEQEIENEGRKGNEVEEQEEVSPGKVVTFPIPHSDAVSAVGVLSQEKIHQTTCQMAQILQLPVSAALTRVVADFLPDPALSLLGEADAAREWVENRQRNHRRRPMTPAFFRRWLAREQTSIQTRQQSQHQDQSPGNPPSFTPVVGQPGAVSLPPDDPYQVFVQRRSQELATLSAASSQPQKGAASR